MPGITKKIKSEIGKATRKALAFLEGTTYFNAFVKFKSIRNFTILSLSKK